jgi:hypothetical protein
MEVEEKNLKTNAVGVMPAFVRYDKKLSTGGKLLYYELSAQSDTDGCCELRDMELMELLNVSESTIKIWIADLTKLGYLKKEMIYYKNSNQIVGRKLIIKNKQHGERN